MNSEASSYKDRLLENIARLTESFFESFAPSDMSISYRAGNFYIKEGKTLVKIIHASSFFDVRDIQYSIVKIFDNIEDVLIHCDYRHGVRYGRLFQKLDIRIAGDEAVVTIDEIIFSVALEST